MKSKRKIFSLLLAICMIMTMSPVFAFAEVPYLSINSGASVISVTDANAEDVLGDGTVSYDRETNTLTLNNAELVPEGSPSAPAIYVSAANKGLNLNVVGKNTISHDQCMSINGQLNISGEGTLDVTGKTYAIMATGGITIDGTVITASTTGSSGGGIHSQSYIMIKNGADVTASSSGVWGIYGKGDITIANSRVESVSTSGNYYAGMMSSSGNIIIEDSSVNAVSANDAGIMTNGDIIITDSDVKATSEFPGVYDDGDEIGIFAIGGENISISGGTVTAVSTGKYANGIYGFSSVRISDNAEVVAETSNEDSWPALCGTSGISISSSKVSAKSGGDAGIFSPETVTIENGSDIDAAGYWPAIRGNSGVIISDSRAEAISTNDVAVFSQENVEITNSIVNASGADGASGVLSKNTVSVSDSWISTSGDETFEEGSRLIIPEYVILTNHGIMDGAIDIVRYGIIECDNHTGGTATCTSKAVCDICGQEYGSLLDHKLIRNEAKEPTLDSAGNIEYWYCEDCGKYFSDKDAGKEIELADTVIPKLPAVTEPEDTEQGNDNAAKDEKPVGVPKTADHNNLLLWITLFGISAIGAGKGLSCTYKKKH
ncbi:MAG: hypothetical protein KH316_01625 [Firmicutes bacterium]|nr:hypothetical protein [Bacillota bacterium]